MKKHLPLFAIFIASSCFISVVKAASDEIALDCAMEGGSTTFFVIKPDKGQSTLVLPESAVEGTLSISKEYYTLNFPETESRWQTKVIVGRYTGTLVWEHGKPPFGEMSLDNVYRTGTCSKSTVIHKF